MHRTDQRRQPVRSTVRMRLRRGNFSLGNLTSIIFPLCASLRAWDCVVSTGRGRHARSSGREDPGELAGSRRRQALRHLKCMSTSCVPCFADDQPANLWYRRRNRKSPPEGNGSVAQSMVCRTGLAVMVASDA